MTDRIERITPEDPSVRTLALLYAQQTMGDVQSGGRLHLGFARTIAGRMNMEIPARQHEEFLRAALRRVQEEHGVADMQQLFHDAMMEVEREGWAEPEK